MLEAMSDAASMKGDELGASPFIKSNEPQQMNETYEDGEHPDSGSEMMNFEDHAEKSDAEMD